MSDAPLKLFWWKSVPNFGDALSQLVVAHVSGREVAHTGPKRAELWAIGSLMHVARQNRDAFRRRPVLWGTGMLGYVPRDVLEHVDVALLRGPVGAALMGLKDTRFGDPGLLAAEALGPAPQRTDTIGLVPHHSLLGDPMITALLEAEPRLRLIDVRDTCVEVCHAIGSCAHVFASSLHGLIVADAFGVPNTWVHPGDQSHFKYYDYAASVGRVLARPLALDEILDALPHVPDTLSYGDGIAASQEALRASFPAALRAEKAVA